MALMEIATAGRHTGSFIITEEIMSYCSKIKSPCAFETTGGLPDVVHLVKYALQVVCGAYEAFTANLKRTSLKNRNIA